jgi:hypothetical protein
MRAPLIKVDISFTSSKLSTKRKRPSAGLFAAPLMALELEFRLAYAGPATMTTIIMPTGIAMVWGTEGSHRPGEPLSIGN